MLVNAVIPISILGEQMEYTEEMDSEYSFLYISFGHCMLYHDYPFYTGYYRV